MICKFKNVHWTVSLETIEEEYEYVRFGGKWKNFLNNLTTISKLKEHKISFNMLHFILNYMSVFDCIKFLQGLGFHNNSFGAHVPLLAGAQPSVGSVHVEAAQLHRHDFEVQNWRNQTTDCQKYISG